MASAPSTSQLPPQMYIQYIGNSRVTCNDEKCTTKDFVDFSKGSTRIAAAAEKIFAILLESGETLYYHQGCQPDVEDLTGVTDSSLYNTTITRKMGLRLTKDD